MLGLKLGGSLEALVGLLHLLRLVRLRELVGGFISKRRWTLQLLWLRGRFDALEPIGESLGGSQPPHLPTLHCARAVTHVETG